MHALAWWRLVRLVRLGRDPKVGWEWCLHSLNDWANVGEYYQELGGVYGVQARGWESRHLLDVWVKVGECHPALAGEYDVQVRGGEYLCVLVGVYDVQVRVREHLHVLVCHPGEGGGNPPSMPQS